MPSGKRRLDQHKSAKKKKEAIYKPTLTKRSRVFDVDKTEITTTIITWITKADNSRSDWMKDYNELYADYYGQSTVETKDEESERDTHIPLSMYHVEKKHASISEVLWGMDKVVVCKPNSEEDLEKTKKREPWINWELKVHMNQLDPELGISAQVDKFVHMVIKYGNAVGMVPWTVDEKFIKESRIYPFPPQRMYRNPETGIPEPLNDENIKIFFYALIEDFFGRKKNIKIDWWKDFKEISNGNGYMYDITYTEIRKVNGRNVNIKKNATIELFVDDDNVELEASYNAINYEGAQVIIIPLEDFFASPDIMYKGIQRCKMVGRRFWQSKDDILRKIQNEEYEITEEDKQKLDDYKTEGKTVGITKSEKIKQTKDRVSGVQAYQSLEDFETFQVFCKYDVNGDGFEEDAVFTIVRNPIQIYLQGKHLSQLYRHNKRPFFDTSYGVKEDSWHTWGALKMLHGLQEMVDIMYNQRTEAGSITNNPFGFYDPTSGFKPETIHVKPGDLIPMANPQASVYFPAFPHSSQVWGFNEEALLNQYADKLMAHGPLSFGNIPNRVGALRTWGAVRDILSQSQQLVKPALKRIKRGLEEMVRQIYQLNAHYMPPGLMFRVMGEPNEEGVKVAKFESMTREELATLPDFEMPWNIANLDDEVRRQVSIMMVQTLINPVLIQLGIVTPEDIYNINKNLLEQHDEPRPELFISKPQGLPDVPVRDPDVENNMMVQGDYPKPSPAENHQSHLISHQGFVFRNKDKLDMNRARLFQTHVSETIGLQNQMAQRQQLIQNAGIMQNQFQSMGLGRGAPGAQETTRAIPTGMPITGPPGEGQMTEEMG